MKKKKKLSLLQRIYKHKRLYILIFIIILIVVLINRRNPNKAKKEVVSAISYAQNKVSMATNSALNTISNVASNTAKSKEIPGQKKVRNMDGYTTTFTCSNSSYPKEYKEFKQNLGSWSQNSYWGGTMEENGCGITAISIIASGYGSDATPETLREKYFPHLDTTQIKSAFNKLGIECTDFCFDASYLKESYVTEWLESGRPILICLGNKKENKWTELSHYMALLDVNSDGELYVSNPNGLDKSEKESNWYKAEEVLPHVVKALFIESYE